MSLQIMKIMGSLKLVIQRIIKWIPAIGVLFFIFAPFKQALD